MKKNKQSEKQIEIEQGIQLSLLNENVNIDVNNEEEKKLVQEKQQDVDKQKSKKSKLKSLLFLLLNIIIVSAILVFQISNENIVHINLSELHYEFLVLLIFTLAIIVIANSEQIRVLIKQETNRSRPALSFQTYALGRYYDCITPLSTGGQPFQALYLSQRGLNASTAVSIPISKYVVNQWCWILYSCINLFFVVNFSLFSNVSIIETASILGFALNILLFAVILVLSISKKVGQTVTVKILKFLEKIKLIKNYEKQYNKVMKVVSEYQSTIRTMTKRIGHFIYLLFLTFIGNICNYLLCFWIYCIFFGFNISMLFPLIVLSFMVDLASSFIPLPGGSGMNEISFSAILAPYFGPNIFWAMILWRIVTYYFYILQGIMQLSYNYAIGNKKYSWIKRKWELENESNIFKNEMLKNYKIKAKKITVTNPNLVLNIKK